MFDIVLYILKSEPAGICKPVDISLFKNQVPKVKVTSDVTIKLREQGLITKECIAIHTN